MLKETDIVSIKSYNSRFVLNIKSKKYDDAIRDVQDRFTKDALLRSITINSVNAPFLDIVDIQRVIDFLKEKFGVRYVEKEEKILKVKEKKEENSEFIQEVGTVSKTVLTDIDTVSEQVLEETDYRTKIIKNNLRSGASISYDGNILVIGDVNAGAELIATGNIIVLGVLRGFANAGVKGDKNVMVIAHKIHATQLRIAELIAIPPKDENIKSTGVQIASVNENKIEIKQY